jgi:uncharacterized protein YceK
MRRRMAICLAVLLASALGGCGTAVNCLGAKGTAPREIYGGVKQDAQNGTTHLAEAFSPSCPSFSSPIKTPSAGEKLMTRTICAGCGVCMLAVDLPVSAVTDTLTLPVTIPTALKRSKENHTTKRHAGKAPKSAAPGKANAPRNASSLHPKDD